MADQNELTEGLHTKVSKSTYDFYVGLANGLGTNVSELLRGILVGIQLQAPTIDEVVAKYNVKRSETA